MTPTDLLDDALGPLPPQAFRNGEAVVHTSLGGLDDAIQVAGKQIPAALKLVERQRRFSNGLRETRLGRWVGEGIDERKARGRASAPLRASVV